MIDYVWLFPVIMAVAALVNGVGSRFLGKIAGYISVAAMVSTFVLASLVFLQVKGSVDGLKPEAMSKAMVENPNKDHQIDHWNAADSDGKYAIALENLFIAKDPANPKPWDTTVRDGNGVHVLLYNWINIPTNLSADRTLNIDFALHVDQLTAIFLMFISFVGSLVFVYATGYMVEKHDGHEVMDPGYARFFSYLALFAASMYTLILGANFAVMFIGWEGVGLCSYLLIGYYYDRQFNEKLSCSDAGKKAFVVNRVGDFGLMLGMFLIFWGLGTVDFQQIIQILTGHDVPAGFGYNGFLITAATLLLFLGATGKSAQIPLFVWLPDAMAGPTPVSALIHAATMVTAGVYMMARLNVLYMLSPKTLLIVAVIGAMTAFVAAFAGLTQRGIKKILAYSTVSQLGFMFLAIGVGSFAAGIFHVFTHAFFKACLFLAAGSIIHALHHEEDVFKMGGLRKKMPLTWIAYLVATLAIAGIFPFAGFWSKDEILYMTYVAGQGDSIYMSLWAIGVCTAAMTAFYMGRSLFLAFHGKTRLADGYGQTDAHKHDDSGHAGHDHAAHSYEGHDDHAPGDTHKHDDRGHHGVAYKDVHESPFSITGVLLVLAFCSAVVGLLNIPKALNPLPSVIPSAGFHHFVAPVTDRGALHIATTRFGFEGHHAPYGAIIVGEKMDPQAPNKLHVDYHGPELILAIMSVLIGAGGLGLAWLIYGAGNLKISERLAAMPLLKPFWNVSWTAWKIDDFYDIAVIKSLMGLCRKVLWFDKTAVDGVVIGTGTLSQRLGAEFRRLQSGQVQVYGLVMFVGVFVFFLYLTLGLTTFLQEKAPKAPPRSAGLPKITAVQIPAYPATPAVASATAN